MSALNHKEGIFVLLEPITNTAGHLSQFKVYLANRTPYDCTFGCTYYRANEQVFAIDDKQVNSQEVFYLAAITLDELNDAPVFKISGALAGKQIGKDVKIKPKIILKAPVELEWASVTGHLLEVYLYQEKKQEADKITANDLDRLKYFMTEPTEVSDKFQFDEPAPEIDLHFEEIAEDEHIYTPAEIIGIQLEAFSRELERAIAADSLSLIVIHGVGKGRLKQEIHRLLKAHPMVRSYEICRDIKYGQGATEIFF